MEKLWGLPLTSSCIYLTINLYLADNKPLGPCKSHSQAGHICTQSAFFSGLDDDASQEDSSLLQIYLRK